jgi:hypothetical protein
MIRARAAAAFLAALLALGAAAPAQDAGGGDAPKPEGKAPPEKTPEQILAEEVKAFVKQYEETFAKISEEEAVAGVAKMKAWYVDPKVGADERKAILKVFSAKIAPARGKETLQEHAAKALGEMGGDTCLGLLKFMVGNSMDMKVSPRNVIKAGLASMGKIAGTKADDVKFLTKLLKGDDDYIADVASALAGYVKTPGAIRRDIFEELLKRSEGVFSKSEANDSNAKRSWNIWGTEVIEAMKKLSGKAFEKPTEFRKWFNEKDEGGGKNPRSWPDPPATGSK